MKKILKKVNFLRATLTIVTVCSIATFVGVFKILVIHNKAIDTGANTDIKFGSAMHIIDNRGKDCQDRLSIIEQQIETLFEFHKGETIKPMVVKYLDE